MAQLMHGLVMMVHPVDVTLREQPAVRVDHHIASVSGAALGEEVADFALVAESEIFHHRHHGVGETVIDAGEVDIGGAEPGALPQQRRGVVGVHHSRVFPLVP